MSNYFSAVAAEMKDWKKAVMVVIFTVARLIFSWSWIHAGYEKAITWFSDGKADSAGLITGMVNNLIGPKVHGLDPLHINSLFAWVAQHIFLGMPYVTDALVVVCEMGVGLFIFVGLGVFWAALVGMFLNTQFATAGSGNNFGYMWTDLAFMKFSKYTGLIGLDGYIRFKKGKKLL